MTVIIFALLAIMAVFYFIYVSLIKKKNKVKEASSGIDVQLKKRYDTIPNLLSMASKYMSFEENLLKEITQLRTQAMETSFLKNPKESVKLENKLSSKLKEFNVSVENYPDLKSSQPMVQAMSSLSDVEENIAAARRFYNAAVNDLNNAVEIFPSSLIANMLNIKQAVFFETPENEKQSIQAGDYFK
ncbi:MAG: LemA family protein [Alphaproteobacteria bacterium]|nr:LemA family protein [Alphaproteobacteria bacterium]